MNQNLLIDPALKGESYEKQFKPKMFSGYFQNIKELQSFLFYAKYFQTKNVVMGLGLAFKTHYNILMGLGLAFKTLKLLKGGIYGKK